jgi:hypothetical protein
VNVLINGHQCRAGRALLRWRREDLAEKTNISVVSIKHFEDEHHQTRTTTIAKITKVMEDAGIEFLPNSGLRLRDDTLTIIEGDDALLRLMDDIYYTLKDAAQIGVNGEVLWGFINESASPPEILAADKKIREANIKMRFLVAAGAQFYPYDLEEYRCIPDKMFHEHTIAIYGDKVATEILSSNTGAKSVIIINNPSYAATHRAMFELIWSTHPKPAKP